MQGSAHRQTSSLIPRRKGSFTSGSESHFVQALWQKPEIPQSLQSYHPGSFLVVQRFGLHTFTAMAWVQSLGQEDLMEKEMATHSSTLVWKIPWMEESGGLHTVHVVAESDMTD